MYRKKNGFTLAELMVSLGLAGIILVVLCGVFVYGMSGIKKGKLRTTALELADRKIAEVQNLMRSLDGNYIKGSDLSSIISDHSNLLVNGSSVDPDIEYNIWDPNGCKVEAEGTVSVRGTADYIYLFRLEDYDRNLKKIRVEVTWKEEKTGPKKIFLETIVSQNH